MALDLYLEIINSHFNFILKRFSNFLYQNFFQVFELTKTDILKFLNKKNDLA